MPPASMASLMYIALACMVRNNSFASGHTFLICRAASIPFSSGIEMSRIVRSGRSRSAASTSDRPSLTCATTS